jgi:hypothetical protein
MLWGFYLLTACCGSMMYLINWVPHDKAKFFSLNVADDGMLVPIFSMLDFHYDHCRSRCSPYKTLLDLHLMIVV